MPTLKERKYNFRADLKVDLFLGNDKTFRLIEAIHYIDNNNQSRYKDIISPSLLVTTTKFIEEVGSIDTSDMDYVNLKINEGMVKLCSGYTYNTRGKMIGFSDKKFTTPTIIQPKISMGHNGLIHDNKCFMKSAYRENSAVQWMEIDGDVITFHTNHDLSAESDRIKAGYYSTNYERFFEKYPLDGFYILTNGEQL